MFMQTIAPAKAAPAQVDADNLTLGDILAVALKAPEHPHFTEVTCPMFTDGKGKNCACKGPLKPDGSGCPLFRMIPNSDNEHSQRFGLGFCGLAGAC
ncbi:MAG: hypothetical protein AB7I36_08405 [Rhodospirillaceae bacterium]